MNKKSRIWMFEDKRLYLRLEIQISMGLFFILLGLFLVVVLVAKVGYSVFGWLFVLAVVVFGCWFVVECNSEVEEWNEREERGRVIQDEAVRQIRERKQMYIDSGWVVPPRM